MCVSRGHKNEIQALFPCIVKRDTHMNKIGTIFHKTRKLVVVVALDLRRVCRRCCGCGCFMTLSCVVATHTQPSHNNNNMSLFVLVWKKKQNETKEKNITFNSKKYAFQSRMNVRDCLLLPPNDPECCFCVCVSCEVVVGGDDDNDEK